MPEEDKFKVPASSKSEIDKIIKAYAHIGKQAALDEVAKLISMDRTRVSANNGFLSSAGIIKGGQAKKATALGLKLGRAMDHEQIVDIKRSWQEIIERTAFLSDLVTSVRLKKGLTKDELVSQVLYSAGLPKICRHETGARTIAEILEESGLLLEKDGKFQVAKSREESMTKPTEEAAAEDQQTPPASKPATSAAPTAQNSQSQPTQHNYTAVSHAVSPSVVINIQLEIPATESETVYNNFFKALRENLLKPIKDD